MRPWLVAAALVLSGCLDFGTSECGGLVCPSGKVCAPSRGSCVFPEQLTACMALTSGEPCSYAGTPHGLCLDGACIGVGCGNGVRDPHEVCDDGNTRSGDGCSSDCTSNESC